MNKTATTIPWDPDCTKFPTRSELPQIPGAPAEAAWVWGDNDYVRRCNTSKMATFDNNIDWSIEPSYAHTSSCCGKRNQERRNHSREV